MSDLPVEATEVSEASPKDWRRLDSRMLLVHPVNELVRFLPFVIGVFLLGGGGGEGRWHYLSVVVPIAIGVFRYFSTRFRITTGQIELRRGVLGRGILTAPLDRVRSVELTASPIHRVLQLEKVVIRTGSGGEEGLELDSLGSAEARRLRRELLDRSGEPGLPGEDLTLARGSEQTLLVLDPRWARFAPLTTSGLVVALAALGAGAGPLFGNNLELALNEASWVEQFFALALPLLLLAAAVAVLALASVLGVAGYLIGNWNFTLTHDAIARTYRVRRGALTTRETTLDDVRLRGVEIHEPLGLRLAGGGRLDAIVTGIGTREASGNNALVPAAPRTVVDGVAARVLGDPGVLSVPLRQHGEAARRRRYVRAVAPGVLVVVVLVLGAVLGDGHWSYPAAALALPAVGAALARDRYARLGHALTPGHVVIRWGSLRGRRDALERDGIIGWRIEQSFFQRRAGLVSLRATTAAGQQSYEILDVPEDVAVALATRAVPGLVDQFLRPHSSSLPR